MMQYIAPPQPSRPSQVCPILPKCNVNDPEEWSVLTYQSAPCCRVGCLDPRFSHDSIKTAVLGERFLGSILHML